MRTPTMHRKHGTIERGFCFIVNPTQLLWPEGASRIAPFDTRFDDGRIRRAWKNWDMGDVVQSASGRKDKMTEKPSNEDARREKAKPKTPGDVGDALRAVYRETIDEAVPDEMLDLLRKLG
ncbi:MULTISPECIES: NepR family anti-sigma factor [unclassified Sphingomonas]|uniref:NepR family anti-sigma factor n=1 Tax=unclassified Sphingomonas TaxID=196159 RepID=UPI000B102843|nr:MULTISPECIES: NepR family anti-sigma factor [unclassified Sphingomonas]